MGNKGLKSLFFMSWLVISILGIVGTLSNLSKFAWMGGEGFEKTDSGNG